MEELNEQLKMFNEIIEKAKKIQNTEEKNKFLKENVDAFTQFKFNINTILRAYLFKQNDNKEQNEMCNIVKNIIIFVLKEKQIYSDYPEFEYYKSDIIEALAYNEERFTYDLQNSKKFQDVNTAMDYLKEREEYIEAIKEEDFQEDSLNFYSARKYINGEYEKSLFGHALILIRINLMNITRENILELIQKLDSCPDVIASIGKSKQKMGFYEKNLFLEYTEVVIKLKSIFAPDKLKDDYLVKMLFTGQLRDSKIIDRILGNLSEKNILNLMKEYIDGERENNNKKKEIEKDEETEKFPSIKEISEYLKKIGLSHENISKFMNKLIKLQTNEPMLEYLSAEFLTYIKFPKDIQSFLSGPYGRKFEWLGYSDLFERLKQKENAFDKAETPYIPVEYFIEKLDIVEEDVSYVLTETLLTLRKGDFYKEDDKKKLEEWIQKHKANQLVKLITDETIEFNKSDSIEMIHNKIIKSYLSGQVIPIDIAKETLKKILVREELVSYTEESKNVSVPIYYDDMEDGNEKISEEDIQQMDIIAKKGIFSKIIAQACIQSITCNRLKQKNIDIGNRVLFGNSDDSRGFFAGELIWYNIELIEDLLWSKSLESTVRIFETMSHEEHHAQQEKNIKDGKIDFLTYNFIRELIIRDYNESYYDENYESIYIESDARRTQHIGGYEFLKELNPELAEKLKTIVESRYIVESEKHTIIGDSKKKFVIGKKENDVSVSEYVGHIIRENPGILQKYPILNVEYSIDGNKKELSTMLQEFEEEQPKNMEQLADFYSVYYGVILERIESAETIDKDLQAKINAFLEKKTLFASQEEKILPSDLQAIYEKYGRYGKDGRFGPIQNETEEMSGPVERKRLMDNIKILLRENYKDRNPGKSD